MKATLFLADGRTKEIAPKNRTDFSLDELSRFVGGFIEIVPAHKYTAATGEDWILVVDEDGKSKKKRLNAGASNAYLGLGGADLIVGDALLCPRSMVR